VLHQTATKAPKVRQRRLAGQRLGSSGSVHHCAAERGSTWWPARWCRDVLWRGLSIFLAGPLARPPRPGYSYRSGWRAHGSFWSLSPMRDKKLYPTDSQPTVSDDRHAPFFLRTAAPPRLDMDHLKKAPPKFEPRRLPGQPSYCKVPSPDTARLPLAAHEHHREE